MLRENHTWPGEGRSGRRQRKRRMNSEGRRKQKLGQRRDREEGEGRE